MPEANPGASAIPATIRIMLVDDHKTMLWGLEKLIESERPRMAVVGAAANGDAAVSMAAALLPDLILLDVDLGGGQCSVDFLPALLANGHSRALMLTGTRDQALLARAVRAGARGVVGKDAPAEQVLEAIGKVLRGELCVDQTLLGSLLAPPPAPVANPESGRIATLTAKERKIIGLVVEGNGATNKAIAQRAFISEQTLRNHLSAIYQKLDLANRLELYVYATKHGVGDSD